MGYAKKVNEWKEEGWGEGRTTKLADFDGNN